MAAIVLLMFAVSRVRATASLPGMLPARQIRLQTAGRTDHPAMLTLLKRLR